MKPLYWRIKSWVSICFMVSSATPTTMRMAVPPRYRLVGSARVANAVNPTVTRFAAQRIALPLEVEPATYAVVARQGMITK